MVKEIFEYRGASDLVYAELLTDTTEAEGLTYGEIKPLAGLQEVGKSTETSSEAHYYDNVPAIVISSTGSDEITLTVSAIPLDVLAEITGQYYDQTTGTFVEGERENKYFAIGYKTKKTNGKEVYVWRLKGTFGIPESTHITEDDGTDANGQELTYTGINTTHRFTKTGKTAKGVNVDLEKDLADVTDFWETVQTPDSIMPKE